MSQADELLESLTATPASTAGAGSREEHIVVGMDRVIVVPEALKEIGVQYDHNMETVTFDCIRFWDGIDMSTMKIYINYIRPDNHMGMYLCEPVTVEDNVMHFDWTISGDVTNVQGNLSFIVCIKKTDEEGNEENHWNSKLCTDLYISEGLKCQESVLRRFPDIITQLLQRMDAVEVEQQRWEVATYEELDGRMKIAEGNTTPEEILRRINEALATEETTQDTIRDITYEYVRTDEVVIDLVDKADQALSIAKGANLSQSYTDYAELISVLNSLGGDVFRAGQNFYIGAVGVPDLFVYGVEETPVEYEFVNDEVMVEQMVNNVWLQVGYYKIARLETQNVDLRDVVIPLMLTAWEVLDEATGTYSQTVVVEGLGEGNNPLILLSPVEEEASDDELESYSCISDVVVEQGQITFIASDLPVISFTVIAKSVTAAISDSVADITALVGRVSELEQLIASGDIGGGGGGLGTDVAVPLLVSDWVEEDGTYIQNITVAGLGMGNVPVIALSSVNEIASEDELYSYACISDVVVPAEETIKFIASEKPSISFTVVVKGVVAAENTTVADITALVGRVSELETEVDGLNSNFSPTEFTPPSSFWNGNGSLLSGGYVQIGKLVIVNMEITKTQADNWYTAVLPKPKSATSLSCHGDANGTRTTFPCAVFANGDVGIVIIQSAITSNLIRVGGIYIAE